MNGWTLTNNQHQLYLSFRKTSVFGISKRTLTAINFNSLSNNNIISNFFRVLSRKKFGDPYGNRTHVCGVRGRRLNRLTNGPCGAPSGIRTLDPLIKSQLLYQLS